MPLKSQQKKTYISEDRPLFTGNYTNNVLCLYCNCISIQYNHSPNICIEKADNCEKFLTVPRVH